MKKQTKNIGVIGKKIINQDFPPPLPLPVFEVACCNQRC